MPFISCPRPRRGPSRGFARVVVGGIWPAFFSPLFCTRRWAWRKFFLAGVMALVSMLIERVFASSLAAPAVSSRAMWRGS